MCISCSQLQDTTMDQASDVFKTNADHELLTSFKQAGLQGNEANVSELAGKFQEHAEQIQEVMLYSITFNFSNAMSAFTHKCT